MPPVDFFPHPGRVLAEQFLEPLGITQTAFSIHLGWTFARLNGIINAKRGITPDSALALSESLPGTTPEFWMNLQRDWDLSQARLVHLSCLPHDKALSETAQEIIRDVLRACGPDKKPATSTRRQ